MSTDKKKTVVGVVSSDKMQKSCVVVVENIKKHPIYGKYIKTRTKFMAHDENNKAVVGDKVVLSETAPVSKNKRWIVSEIIGKV